MPAVLSPNARYQRSEMGLDWDNLVHLHVIYHWALGMPSSYVLLLGGTAEAQYLGKELILHRKVYI